MRSREVGAAPRHSLVAVLFLACAIALGGGGSPNPGTELLLQLVFVAAALAWLWLPAEDGSIPRPQARSFWLIGVLVVALPLLQLMPLPPEVWTGLGGQDDRVAALALVGREHTWQPLSRSPARTLAALLAMIPALFAFFTTASLGARGRWWIAGAIAAMTLAAALLGALQISLGVLGGPYFYEQNSATLTGFQANRNSTADVLLIGIAASAAFLVPSLLARDARSEGGGRFAPLGDRRTAAILLAVLTAVLFFATLLTASRIGIALLPVALLGAWAILYPALARLGRLRLVPALLALLAVPAIGLIAWQSGNRALGTVAERFVFSGDPRLDLWRDGLFAIKQAWPFGVGLGGAQPALIAAERLEVLDPYVPNRVHNDYLELALEGGLPALAILAVIGVILAFAVWRSWRERPQERHLTVLGIVILLVTALHSFVDYPLRSMALACLIGTGAGLLMSTPRRSAADEPSA
jgi:exopolysaccharide production protein ExoQ